jgi:histidyl-tRNA synthetase
MLIDTPVLLHPDTALVPLGEAAEQAAIALSAKLRRAGISCETAFKGNMKKRMQKAAASGARYAIILGQDELGRGEASVKELATGEQRSVPLDRLVETVRAQ